MNIEYLHYFIDVAKTKSITQAAKLNFISPQGMSRAMNELEKELGCQLLIRYSNKLSLSETGEEMIPRAEQIIDRYTEMLDFAAAKSRESESKSRSILLECQAVAMLALFDRKTKDYVFDCPDIHFREAQNSQIRQNLLSISDGKTSDSTPTIGLMGFFNQERASDSEGIADLQKRGYVYRPYLKTFDKVIVSAHSDLAKKLRSPTRKSSPIPSCRRTPICTTPSRAATDAMPYRFRAPISTCANAWSNATQPYRFCPP